MRYLNAVAEMWFDAVKKKKMEEDGKISVPQCEALIYHSRVVFVLTASQREITSTANKATSISFDS